MNTQDQAGLSGRVALVTGGARRIGRAIALALADAGCDVAIHFRSSPADAEETARLIGERGRRTALLDGDLADEDAAAALPERTVAQLGRLDVLINNASTFERVPLEDLTARDWQQTFAVNAVAPAILARAAAPRLRQHGAGRIVNLVDIAAERPWENYLAYCASKAALVCLTRGLAKTLAPDITVNAIAPGIAEFPEHYDQATRARLAERVPMRRAGSPADIAGAVLYLVRDAVYTTGSIIAVDGGRSVEW